MTVRLRLLKLIWQAEHGDSSGLAEFVRQNELTPNDRAFIADFIAEKHRRKRGRPSRHPLLRSPTSLDVAERYFRKINNYLTKRRGRRLYKTADADPRDELIEKVAVKWHVTGSQLRRRLDQSKK